MIAHYLEPSPGPNANRLKFSTKVKKTGDTDLIDRCKNNDRLAQSELYKKWYNKVFSVCLRYANDRDQAKNMVNETFFKIFKNINKISDTQAFGGWIKRIAVNTCIDHIRSNQKFKFVDGNEIPEQGIDNNIVSRLAAEDILAILQKVTPASRVVFSLYIIEGFKHKEIAVKLNIKESTSRWHLLNAKKEMKEFLKTY